MATWDKNNPPGSEKLRNSDDMLRDNFAALESALTSGAGIAIYTGGDQSGKLESPTYKDVSKPPTPTTTNEITTYNVGGVLKMLRDDGKERELESAIPSGTKMFFKESAAPTGWTFKSEDNDRALINTSTEGDGGSTGGSWTIGLSVDGHALTVSEIPSHNHNLPHTAVEKATGNDEEWNGTAGNGTQFNSTNSTGGGGSHNHGLSGDDGSWRPSYVKVITCSKD